jgi:hypothetical protein
MNEVQHVTISLAGSAIDVFVDGDQRWISLTSMGAAVDKQARSAFEFFNGKSPEVSQAKALSAFEFRNFRHGKFKTLVKCCPLGGAKFYWKYLQRKGNIQADALMLALAEDAIERRVNGALGIHQTEAQYEEQTTKNRETIKKALKLVSQIELMLQDDSVTSDQVKTTTAEKEQLVQQLDPEELSEYLDSTIKVWEQSRKEREKSQPVGVQQFNNWISSL